MKKFLFSLVFACVTTLAVAQLDTAHDFTVTDINGEEFHLYEILDSGKVVVLDVSATWCPPCWSFHQTHISQDLHDAYGPDGTDQIRVIFYEADVNTDDDDLNGTGSNTLGDWVSDGTYTIVNENPLQLEGDLYYPFGFPTISIIRPEGYKITHDLWNASSVSDFEDAINESITLSGDMEEEEEEEIPESISIFPTLASNLLTIDLSNTSVAIDNALITNALGQVVLSQELTAGGVFELNVANMAKGVYFVNLQVRDEIFKTEKFTKQ